MFALVLMGSLAVSPDGFRFQWLSLVSSLVIAKVGLGVSPQLQLLLLLRFCWLFVQLVVIYDCICLAWVRMSIEG